MTALKPFVNNPSSRMTNSDRAIKLLWQLLASALLFVVQLREGHCSADNVQYTLITASLADCRGQATYPVFPQSLVQSNSEWTTASELNVTFRGANATVVARTRRVEDALLITEGEEHRLVQREHRGGFCDCWAVANLTVNNDSNLQLNESCNGLNESREFFQSIMRQLDIDGLVAAFCFDSALVPREFTLFPANASATGCATSTAAEVDLPPTNCYETDLRVELSFDLSVHPQDCDAIDGYREGMELSFRNVIDGKPQVLDWIPLMFFVTTLEKEGPSFFSLTDESFSEAPGNITLRGYRVPYVNTTDKRYTISVCGSEVLKHPMQFRWVHNSLQRPDDGTINGPKDVIMLDNVTVTLRNDTHGGLLFEDCFEDGSFAGWNSDLSYNIEIVHNTSNSSCKPSNGGALFFYLQPPATFFNDTNGKEFTLSSRQIVMNALDVCFSSPISSTCAPTDTSPSLLPQCDITTGNATTSTGPSVSSTTVSEVDVSTPAPTSPTSTLTTTASLSDVVLKRIMANQSFSRVLQLIRSGDPLTALIELNALLDSRPVNFTAIAYLLSATVNSLGRQTVSTNISQLIFTIAGRLSVIARDNAEEQEDFLEDVAGSTILRVLDTFALNNHNASTSDRNVTTTNNNIEYVIDDFLVGETADVSTVKGTSAEIAIPIEDILKGLEQVRIASFLFMNMTGLLPNSLEGAKDNNTSVVRLASPVISASFLCDNCTTSNLSTPVKISFRHEDYDEQILRRRSRNGSVTCVFWKFDEDLQQPEGERVLHPGRWSTDGCYQNLSNSTVTVCECNHLTHFAILLSARPLPDVLALQIIGYIGVSISLVAMAATIFVFVFLKPLRTMRNYIHIQLCVTLGIAQIIFVAGVEPRLEEGKLVGGVPVGCRLVAVLLHYWFLVSFMWMLMEGVVLYVALVRVFVKHHGRYIAAFTVASYGIPLIYVGCLTVPLGFARSESIRRNQAYDYGYEQACYLNPVTSFIWSFIAPVILILLANVGFFIMAVVIMQRHQKRQSKDKKHKIKHWLKATISLTVVMGITWIIGVLVIEVKALFPLAYIFTICVAFQGLFIFIIFVLLSKQVRENYAKWWKAKVAGSDFLSRHFGEKSLTLGTTAMTAQRSGPSSSLGKSNGHSSKKSCDQSHVIENSYLDSKPQELTNSSSGGQMDILEMKRASPNHYEYHTQLNHSAVLS